jgi:GTPase SAR1 family protein
MGQQNGLKIKCKKLMKVESLCTKPMAYLQMTIILLIHVLNIDSHILLFTSPKLVVHGVWFCVIIYVFVIENCENDHKMKCTYFIRISNMKANCLTFLCLLCMFVIMNLVGKTTLRKGLVHSLAHGSTFSKIFLNPTMDFLSKLKEGLRQTQRTHGIEICELKVKEGVNLTIWDMAGQEEFHAFHDFMLPNLDGTSYPSLFLLVCNPLKHVQGDLQEAIPKIEGELDYWLRFIASKNRQSNIFKPKAIVVFTHSDKIDVNAHAPGIVTFLNTKFDKKVDVASNPIIIDSHSSGSARLLVKLIQENVQALLNTLPPVYEVCITMRLALKAWVSKHPNNPFMDQDTFSKLCQKTILPRLVKFDQNVITLDEDALIKLNEDRDKAVAKCLHTSGDIIFFEDWDFLVVDVDWFCHQVMGHLIKFSHDQGHVTNHVRLPLTNEHGFTTKERLQHFLDNSIKSSGGRKLKNVQTKQLIDLMLRLELCFEGTCGPLEEGLFIPTTLASHSNTSHSVLAPWEWRSRQIRGSLKEPVYFGRRLQCDDQACTFIPPGFFCRLQVCGTYVNSAIGFVF